MATKITKSELKEMIREALRAELRKPITESKSLKESGTGFVLKFDDMCQGQAGYFYFPHYFRVDDEADIFFTTNVNNATIFANRSEAEWIYEMFVEGIPLLADDEDSWEKWSFENVLTAV
jgi:hypothetical protein